MQGFLQVPRFCGPQPAHTGKSRGDLTRIKRTDRGGATARCVNCAKAQLVADPLRG